MWNQPRPLNRFPCDAGGLSAFGPFRIVTFSPSSLGMAMDVPDIN
jgi:hypothetical protein